MADKTQDQPVAEAPKAAAKPKVQFKVTGYDPIGGKVHFQGEEGEEKNVTVNGKHGKVKIEDGLGIFAVGSPLKQYPAVTIHG